MPSGPLTEGESGHLLTVVAGTGWMNGPQNCKRQIEEMVAIVADITWTTALKIATITRSIHFNGLN